MLGVILNALNDKPRFESREEIKVFLDELIENIERPKNDGKITDEGKSVQGRVVMSKPPKLGISTLCRLMDDCLPEQIECESDMQLLIDKLWPALVCEFELDT